MNTPWFFTCSQSSSFCHWSSVYVGGRAESSVCPLSATDLVYLSGEGLDDRSVLLCSQSSVSVGGKGWITTAAVPLLLSTANLMHLSGEDLVHRCHHVSVQIICCVVVLVQPLLLCCVGYRYASGMYECRGLYWVSTGSNLCVTWAVAGAASSVLGLAVRGRQLTVSFMKRYALCT